MSTRPPRIGTAAQSAFLRLVTSDQLVPVDLTGGDRRRCADLAEQYASLRLDLIDASLIAVAERLNLTTLATLKRRDFAVVLPRHAVAFTPAAGLTVPGGSRRSGTACKVLPRPCTWPGTRARRTSPRSRPGERCAGAAATGVMRTAGPAACPALTGACGDAVRWSRPQGGPSRRFARPASCGHRRRRIVRRPPPANRGQHRRHAQRLAA